MVADVETVVDCLLVVEEVVVEVVVVVGGILLVVFEIEDEVGEVVAVGDVLCHLHFLPRETHDHPHHHHGTNLLVAVLEEDVKMVVAVDAVAVC